MNAFVVEVPTAGVLPERDTEHFLTQAAQRTALEALFSPPLQLICFDQSLIKVSGTMVTRHRYGGAPRPPPPRNNRNPPVGDEPASIRMKNCVFPASETQTDRSLDPIAFQWALPPRRTRGGIELAFGCRRAALFKARRPRLREPVLALVYSQVPPPPTPA